MQYPWLYPASKYIYRAFDRYACAAKKNPGRRSIWSLSKGEIHVVIMLSPGLAFPNAF